MPSPEQTSPLRLSYHRAELMEAFLAGCVCRRQKRTLFFELQIGCLDHIREHMDVGIDLFPELLAGTAAGVHRHSLELVADPWIGHCAAQLCTKFIGDRRRGARRNK